MRNTTRGLLLMLLAGNTLAQNLPPPQVLRIDNGRADRGHAVASDAAGNVWVAGSVEDGSRATRLAVARYDARGSMQWRTHAPGTFGGPEGEVRALAVDAAGNAYATGRVFVTTGFQPRVEGVLFKLSPTGAVLWTRALGLSGGVAIALGPGGEAFVGTANGGVLRFDAGGALQWQRAYAGDTGGDTFSLVALRRDASGHIVVAGSGVSAFSATQRFAADGIAIKYDADGNRLWHRAFSATSVSDEHVWAMALTTDGSVLLNGTYSEDTSGELPVTPLLLRYDAAGTLQFARIADELGGNDVAVGGLGEITVAGMGRVTRVDAAGQPRWSSAAGTAFGVERLAPAPGAAVYASGGFGTALLGADGTVLGSHVFLDGQRLRAGTAALHRDARGVLYAAGTTSTALSTSADFVTLRYAGDATPVPGIPAAPTGLAASTTATAVNLRWVDASDNESAFRVERCHGANCTSFATITELADGSTSYLDGGVRRNTVFRYRVRALNAAGLSPPGEILSVRTL